MAASKKTYLDGLTKKGWSLQQIATELGVSKSTAGRWLRGASLRTIYDPLSNMEWRHCKVHGRTVFLKWKSKDKFQYKCRECNAARQSAKRMKDKQALVDHMGGKCSRCEYDECLSALQFHHIRRIDKEVNISRLLTDGKVKEAWEEAKKCVLLCSNCHFEVEEEEGHISY